MSEEKYWVAMIKKDNNYYLMADNKGTLQSEPSEESMLTFFTGSYVLACRRGVQGRTSAQLFASTFQPSVINMSIEEMGKKLFNLKEGVRPEQHASFFGKMTLLPCNAQNKNTIEKIFGSGSKPKFSLEE